MKSPEELSRRLVNQWQKTDLRESRLLRTEDAWPVVLPIGKPPPNVFSSDLNAVKRHVERWREMSFGEVIWEFVAYRATSEPVEIPTHWKLQKPTEWMEACHHPDVKREFKTLATLIELTDPVFHSTLIRRRSIWRSLALEEVVQATRLALKCEPGCAAGKPLRMLSIAGIDTKFFERNTRLVTALLNARYDGEASRIGLENFLGACQENDHWLLLADLDSSLISFRQQRVRASELAEASLDPAHLLVIENERCLHQLPPLPGTLAILGAGNNLSWLRAPWISRTKIIYWGDLDTWGLTMLATARQYVPTLSSFLMNKGVFDSYQQHAVPEPVIANSSPPTGLLPEEIQLYTHLVTLECGRLEQEFLPNDLIHDRLRKRIQAESHDCTGNETQPNE